MNTGWKISLVLPSFVSINLPIHQNKITIFFKKQIYCSPLRLKTQGSHSKTPDVRVQQTTFSRSFFKKLLFGKQGYREKNLPFTGSLPRWPQQPGLSQAEARNSLEPRCLAPPQLLSQAQQQGTESEVEHLGLTPELMLQVSQFQPRMKVTSYPLGLPEVFTKRRVQYEIQIFFFLPA